MATTIWSVTILITILVLTIVYVIVLFELYKQQKFIFAPYKPPTPPGSVIYPLGTITPLTPTEIAARRRILEQAS